MSEYLEKLTISEAFYHTVNLYPERRIKSKMLCKISPLGKATRL